MPRFIVSSELLLDVNTLRGLDTSKIFDFGIPQNLVLEIEFDDGLSAINGKLLHSNQPSTSNGKVITPLENLTFLLDGRAEFQVPGFLKCWPASTHHMFFALRRRFYQPKNLINTLKTSSTSETDLLKTKCCKPFFYLLSIYLYFHLTKTFDHRSLLSRLMANAFHLSIAGISQRHQTIARREDVLHFKKGILSIVALDRLENTLETQLYCDSKNIDVSWLSGDVTCDLKCGECITLLGDLSLSGKVLLEEMQIGDQSQALERLQRENAQAEEALECFAQELKLRQEQKAQDERLVEKAQHKLRMQQERLAALQSELYKRESMLISKHQRLQEQTSYMIDLERKREEEKMAQIARECLREKEALSYVPFGTPEPKRPQTYKKKIIPIAETQGAVEMQHIKGGDSRQMYFQDVTFNGVSHPGFDDDVFA